MSHKWIHLRHHKERHILSKKMATGTLDLLKSSNMQHCLTSILLYWPQLKVIQRTQSTAIKGSHYANCIGLNSFFLSRSVADVVNEHIVLHHVKKLVSQSAQSQRIEKGSVSSCILVNMDADRYCGFINLLYKMMVLKPGWSKKYQHFFKK